jgi:AcrR family transcriptional regulator
MTDGGSPTPARKPRIDAQRNRTRLLDEAKAVFAEKGAAASLEEVARKAGVGIGTLYRHFPTRDALIAAVYRNETDQLIAAVEQLSAEEPPVEALRQWMLLFADYLAAKHGMAEVLRSVAGGTSNLYAASTAQVKQAIAMLVERASGEIHLGLDPLDLLPAPLPTPIPHPAHPALRRRLPDRLSRPVLLHQSVLPNAIRAWPDG